MLTDQMIAQAAGEYMEAHIAKLEKEFENLPPHQFSKKFERKIAKLKRKADHPILYRTLYRVASIILAVLIGSGVWLAFDTDARAAFFGWVREVYRTQFVYRFIGDADKNKEPMSYQLTLIPDGYTEFFTDTEPDRVSIVYANETGQFLKFTYSNNPSGTDWFVDGIGLTRESTTVNGVSADLLISADPATAPAIVWITPDDTAFTLSGFFAVDELVAIAESVKPAEK